MRMSAFETLVPNASSTARRPPRTLQHFVRSVRSLLQPSGEMYIARMFCSDPECEFTLVLEAGDVMEIAAALCECGCTLDVQGLPDWVEDPGVTLIFPQRRPAPARIIGIAA